MIRDQVIFERKMNFLQTKCFSCNSKNHISIHCPLIHFVPNRIKIVKRHMKDPGQPARSLFKRLRIRKFNSLFSLEYVKKTTQNIKDLFSDLSYDNDDQRNPNDSGELSPDPNSENKTSINDENANKNQLLKILPKSNSQKFSQYFIKESPHNMAIHQSSFDMENIQMNEPFIMGKIPENFTSFSQNIVNMPIMETENEEAKQERETIEQNLMITCVSNHSSDSFKKIADRNSPHNHRHPHKISMENHLEIPSHNIYKSFTSETNINNNNNLRSSVKQKYSIQEGEKILIPMSPAANNNNNNKFPMSPVANNNNNNVAISNGKIPCDNNNYTDFTDIFLKAFEKGTNFKNFYPDSNISKIILENRIKHKKMKTTVAKGPRTPLLNKKIKTITKINRIVPDESENDKKPPMRIESFTRKEAKRYSNIFLKKNEAKFSEKKNKMSFYDVVNEVLYNNELRRKLALLNKKNSNKRKKKDD